MAGIYRVNESDIAFRVYKYKFAQDFYEFFEFIKFSDLINSELNLNYIDVDTATLTFKNREFAEDIVKNEATYIFERIIYNENELDFSANKFNPIFFLDDFNLVDTFDNQNSYQFFLIDWKGYVENRVIIEHNVEYNGFLELPVDPGSGEYYFPDDFNKIKYPNLNHFGDSVNSFEEIMIDIYQKNIGYLGSDLDGLPYFRNKGLPHNYGSDVRRVNGFSGLIIDNKNFPNYEILSEKKSILDFKKDFFNFSQGQNIEDVYQVFGFLEENTPNEFTLKIRYFVPENLTIDNLNSKDKPVAISFFSNFPEFRNDILIEDSNENFFSVTAVNNESQFINNPEILEKAESDEGNVYPLEKKANEAIEKYRLRLLNTLEIEFQEKIFLKDILTGQKVELLNFDEKINGIYQIRGISEIWSNDDNYVSYTINNQEKIS